MEKDSKIYVAGHKGLVGSVIVERLKKEVYTNLVYKTHSELELTDQSAVFDFFKAERLESIFLAAAEMGGIFSNNTYGSLYI